MELHRNALAHACRVALGSIGLVVLAGCGGGGSDTTVRPDPPPAAPPPEPVVYDPDPRFIKHLTVTNTDDAHAAGFTGAGVRIGVVDSGVNRNHPALAPRVVSNLVYLDPSRNNLDVDDVDGHGTAVAQIIAGTAFGAWPGGMAPGAEIVSARIISDNPPVDDGSGQGNEVDGALGLKPIHQDLIDRGVRIMNNSWGGLYWTNPEATAPIADEYRPFIIQHGGLVVFATGNEEGANPSSMAALPSQPGVNGTMPGADLERGWIAVAAVDTDAPDTLSSYSNACGVAMDYCMVAPGNVVATGTNDPPDVPTYYNWAGTSFAAPQVSGAAALVWEAFPYFNNDLVRQTLLGTATDLGAAGVDAVFGHGLLNAGAAVQGPGRLDWGQVVADFDGGTSTWANDITGAGGITKRGTGELVLTGSNAYTGATRVESGILTTLSSLPGDAVVGVDGGLALDASGVAGNLGNDGVVFMHGGDSQGYTHVVGGDFRQGEGALLAFDVGSQLQVAGSAQIDGDAMVAGITEGYVHQSSETFLTAAGGITGTFDNLLAGEGVFLEASLAYTANAVALEIQRLDVDAAAQAFGLSAAAVGSAVRVENAFRMIDGGGVPVTGGPLPGGFIQGASALQRTPTIAAAEQSLASLSGEMHAADAAFAMMAIEGGRHALESRLDTLDRTGVAGAWAQRLDGERSMWSHARLDSNGWMIGHDRWFGPNLMVGTAFGQSDGYGVHDLRGDRERNRQLEGQLYAAWENGGNYVLGRLAAGRIDRRMQRDILLGSQSFGVGTDYDNRYTTLGVQAGHRFELAGATLTPYLGTQAIRLERDGFTEQGAAGFGLSTAGSTLDATQALAGARLERQWSVGAATVSLQGRLEWQHTLSQSGSAIDARFTGLDVWSPIGGAGLDDNATVFGFGLGVDTLRAGRFGLNLDTRQEGGRRYTGAFANWSFGF
ncbi:S8 family serine peptidase [Novilysobacter arseniciresistens]|uniref:S8 family serine peptidase n=1 Tax=Novilysobacter arseniciresistens TaxID=1385522 RepID=UPI00068E5231|nr:S8 family serine peptidase [Lysobacter arseniciresistens]